MSILNPTRGTIRAAIVEHADMLASKAQRLREYGESFDDFTDADFLQHVGDEYGGAPFVRQILDEVAKASEVRPSDVFPLQHALFDVFATAQRANAAGKAGQKG